MKDSFVEYFKSRGVSEGLADTVYEYLQKWMNRTDLAVKSSDNISKVYGIVDEDLDDFVIKIGEENGRVIPESTDYWEKPVVTLEDLIDFVATFPKKSA